MNSNADSFRKELENIRRNIEKLENSFAEMPSQLKALKSRMNDAEEWTGDLEYRIVEIPQSGLQTENQVKKYESNIKDIWDNVKQAKILIIRSEEGRGGKEGRTRWTTKE